MTKYLVFFNFMTSVKEYQRFYFDLVSNVYGVKIRDAAHNKSASLAISNAADPIKPNSYLMQF